MMAMALNNVIQFPDSGRNPISGPDRGRLLRESRDLLAQKLRESLRALLPAIQEELAARGDVADEREQRNVLYGARDLIEEHAVRLEALLAGHWLRLFDEAVRGGTRTKPVKAEGLDDLQLVDFGEMDEDLAVKNVAGRLRDGCEDGLFAAGRRLAFLSGNDDGMLAIDDLVARALRASITEMGFSGSARLLVLRGTEPRAVDVFAPAVHAVNAFLVGRNVLPKLRRSYVRDTPEKRDNAGDPAREKNAGDVFALLQRLVGASAPVAGGMAGGIAGGSGPGLVAPDGAAMASMAMAMERVMASLDVLQRSVPVVADAGPSTNVLREFRSSGAGQELGHLDAITVDIVATLFDFIFEDKAIADPIKALIGRLQIPVLKVAMLDKTFFSSKSHPARHLLDVISRAAVRCGPSAGHEDPLYARIVEIIERLQHEFAQDTGLFEVLCTELDAFLEVQEREADAKAVRAAPLVVAQERREMALLAAGQALADWLPMALPPAVTDLLDNEWRSLLVRHHIAGDEAAWQATLDTAADLVASVQPQPEAKDRKLLAVKLPVLVKRIHDGLNQLEIPDGRRFALVDALFSLHAAVLRGASPTVAVAVQIGPAAEPEIASEHIEDGDTQLDSISLVDGDALPATVADVHDQVAQLQRGDWVEFAGPAGALRYRLAWVSPERGILLFTNPQSPRALSVAPAALALQIERGEAALVPVEPIFDRAVNRALESLAA